MLLHVQLRFAPHLQFDHTGIGSKRYNPVQFRGSAPEHTTLGQSEVRYRSVRRGTLCAQLHSARSGPRQVRVATSKIVSFVGDPSGLYENNRQPRPFIQSRPDTAALDADNPCSCRHGPVWSNTESRCSTDATCSRGSTRDRRSTSTHPLDRQERHPFSTSRWKCRPVANSCCLGSSGSCRIPMVRHAIRAQPLRWLQIKNIQTRTRSTWQSELRLCPNPVCRSHGSALGRLCPLP